MCVCTYLQTFQYLCSFITPLFIAQETDTSEVTRKLITAGIDRTSVAKLLKYLKLEGDLNFLDELEKDKYLLELPDAKEIIEQLRCFLTYCTNFRVPFKVCACIRIHVCVCVYM